MRSKLVLLLASALVLGVSGCSHRTSEEHAAVDALNLTSQDEAAVLDALRARMEPEIPNQDIVFDFQGGVFRVMGDYAWLQGRIALRGGGEPTTRGTLFQPAATVGLFDGFHIEALLRKDERGVWAVLERGVGVRDVWWWEIWDSYPNADRALWGDLPNE